MRICNTLKFSLQLLIIYKQFTGNYRHMSLIFVSFNMKFEDCYIIFILLPVNQHLIESKFKEHLKQAMNFDYICA